MTTFLALILSTGDLEVVLQLPFVPHLAGVPLTHPQLHSAGKKTVTPPSSRTSVLSLYIVCVPLGLEHPPRL